MDVHPTKNGINRYWPIPICISYIQLSKASIWLNVSVWKNRQIGSHFFKYWTWFKKHMHDLIYAGPSTQIIKDASVLWQGPLYRISYRISYIPHMGPKSAQIQSWNQNYYGVSNVRGKGFSWNPKIPKLSPDDTPASSSHPASNELTVQLGMRQMDAWVPPPVASHSPSAATSYEKRGAARSMWGCCFLGALV